MNADGTGLTLIYQDGVKSQLAISPQNDLLAFIAHTPSGEFSQFGFTLNLMTIPGWETTTITTLDLKDNEQSPQEAFEWNAFETSRAITNSGPIAWSPDGRYLAFVSGHDGVSADLYVYTRASGEIRRITDGPSQAYGLSWSPDSRYIFHSGANSFGTGAGYNLAGAWVASVEGNAVIQVMPAGSGDNLILDWVTKDILLVYSWNMICGFSELTEIHLDTGDQRVLWPDCMESFHYDREEGTVLISNLYSMEFFEENILQGVYRVIPGQDGYKKLSDRSYQFLIPGGGDAAWFGFNRQDGLYSLDEDVQVIRAYTENPYKDSYPINYFPEENLLFLYEWEKEKTYIVQPGGELLTSIPMRARTVRQSPVDSELFFFLDEDLYAMRSGEWRVYLVSDQMKYAREIYWVP